MKSTSPGREIIPTGTRAVVPSRMPRVQKPRRGPMFFLGMCVACGLVVASVSALAFVLPSRLVYMLERVARWQGYELVAGGAAVQEVADEGALLWSDAFARGEGDDRLFESIRYGFRVDVPFALASVLPQPTDERLQFGLDESAVFVVQRDDMSLPEGIVFEEVLVGTTTFRVMNAQISPPVVLEGIDIPVMYEYTIGDTTLLFYTREDQQGQLLSLLRTFQPIPTGTGVLATTDPLFLRVENTGRADLQLVTATGSVEQRRALQSDRIMLDAARDVPHGVLWTLTETAVLAYDMASANVQELVSYAPSSSGRLWLSHDAEYIAFQRLTSSDASEVTSVSADGVMSSTTDEDVHSVSEPVVVSRVVHRSGAFVEGVSWERFLGWISDRSFLAVVDGRLAMVQIQPDGLATRQFVENVLASAQLDRAHVAVAPDGTQALIMAPSRQQEQEHTWTMQWLNVATGRMSSTGTTILAGIDQSLVDQYARLSYKDDTSLHWFDAGTLLFSYRGNAWMLEPNAVSVSSQAHRSSVGVVQRVLADGRVVSVRPVVAPDGSVVAQQGLMWDPRSSARTLLAPEDQWISL